MIYYDNAATTACYEETLEMMMEYNKANYFNPSALYSQSTQITNDIKLARKEIKDALHAPENSELYFLSGGTEADNTALFCTRKKKGSRIIVSEGEHDAVINSANQLKNQGYDVQFAPITEKGIVDVEKFKALLDENTSFVSIMHVSNETGAINDIKQLVTLTRKFSPNAVFHSDGVQAFCKINVNLRNLDVDLYSISGHKIHAPKGIGALYVKKGVSIKPLLYGGGQEKGFRSGTESAPLIVAFQDAVKRNMNNFEQNYSKIKAISEYLMNYIKVNIPNTVIISSVENSAPNILTVAFENVRGEVLLHTLEKHGILVGIGSACSSHHESRFKELLGLDKTHRDGIIRFSFSEFNTLEEAKFVADKISAELKELQSYVRV